MTAECRAPIWVVSWQPQRFVLAVPLLIATLSGALGTSRG